MSIVSLIVGGVYSSTGKPSPVGWDFPAAMLDAKVLAFAEGHVRTRAGR